MSTLPNIKFLYGENLSSSTPFIAGNVYFDKKGQIWFDDPTGKTTKHTRLTSLPSYTEVSSLPGVNAGYKHNDIVVVKTKVAEGEFSFLPYIFNEDTQVWHGLNSSHNAS